MWQSFVEANREVVGGLYRVYAYYSGTGPVEPGDKILVVGFWSSLAVAILAAFFARAYAKGRS